MTIADDVRAAKKERQFHSARDFETSASQIGEVGPLAEDLKVKAQRIIAGNAQGDTHAERVADATLLMRMLGVHPDDTFDPSIAMDMPLPTPQNNSGIGRR